MESIPWGYSYTWLYWPDDCRTPIGWSSGIMAAMAELSELIFSIDNGTKGRHWNQTQIIFNLPIKKQA